MRYPPVPTPAGTEGGRKELVLEVPPRREPELRSTTPSETVVKLNDAVILLVSDMGPFDPGPKGSSGLSIEKAPRTIGES